MCLYNILLNMMENHPYGNQDEIFHQVIEINTKRSKMNFVNNRTAKHKAKSTIIMIFDTF